MTFQFSPEYPIRCARILAIHAEAAAHDRTIAASEAAKRELAEELKAIAPENMQELNNFIDSIPRRAP